MLGDRTGGNREWGMKVRLVLRVSVAIALIVAAQAGQPALAQKRPPYWASIRAGEALMRTGPGRNFPAVWLYRRAGLPVKVIETFESWRKVEDPDGTQGWMQVRLLSEDRTAIVRDGVQPMLVRPEPGSRIAWRAAPGVVGRLGDCSAGFCRFDVGGKRGYVNAEGLWGPGEP